MAERYYRFKDFAEKIGVDRHTLNNWKKKGKLVPLIDEDGKEYYSAEQADLVSSSSVGKRIYDGDNWVDLSSIEYDRIRQRYNWKKACEKKQKVLFFYNGIEGFFYLIRVKNNTITIEINGKEDSISTGMLTSIHLGRLTGNISFEHKYAVAERVQKGNTDITILAQCRVGTKNVRAYRYICNRCGQENTVTEYNITNTGCCPVCSGSRVVVGINDIATTDPWMVPFFADEQLSREYSHGSKAMPIFHCPDCGRIRKKPLQICTLYRTRSIGCVCGDGYSYPNKFMFSILEQLQKQKKIVEFVNEYNDDWTKNKKFDFLVSLIPDGKRIIIEMDGKLGHGYNSIDENIPPEKAKEIDAWKDAQARIKNIPVFRVDARKSRIEYLQDNITQTISSIIDLSDVRWDEADKFAISNLTKEVCSYYEAHKPITTDQLGKVFHIAQTTALSYIQRGENYGWCTYDWDFYYERKYARTRKGHEIREKRIVEICEYYKRNKPILAIDVARHFGIYTSTVLSYLRDGEKLGYEPYDKKYANERQTAQLKSTSKEHLKRPVVCFALDKSFYRRYASLKEAADDNGVSLSAIHRCCKKKGTSAGRIFRFEDDCEFI